MSETTPRKILLPVDGSILSEVVATAALDLAARSGASIVALAVAPPRRGPPLAMAAIPVFDEHRAPSEKDRSLHRQLVSIATSARALGIPCETCTVVSSDAAHRIVQAVKDLGCDLVFMGSHHRRGIALLFKASVTAKVVARSPVPVTVYPVSQEDIVRASNRIDLSLFASMKAS